MKLSISEIARIKIQTDTKKTSIEVQKSEKQKPKVVQVEKEKRNEP